MKTIILSLTIVLGLLISPAFAQIVKSNDGNSVVTFHTINDYVQINIEAADPVGITPDPVPAYDVIPRPKTAGYISPLGFTYRGNTPDVDQPPFLSKHKNKNYLSNPK